MIALFIGLLVLHVWLLTRTLERGDALISILLVVAIVLFVQRLMHYALPSNRPREPARRDARQELLHLRKRTLIFLALIAMHAFVLWQFVGTEDLWVVVLLAASMGLFVYRTAVYSRRYLALRRAA